MNDTTPMTNDRAFEFADAAPDFAVAIARCWNWSFNFNNFEPFRMLLDLIGFSEGEYGENLHDLNKDASTGLIELNMIADALKEYANRPSDCEDWIRDLIEIEIES